MTKTDSFSVFENGLEAYDLTRAASELAKHAPSLFLPEGVDSRLEIRDYIANDTEMVNGLVTNFFHDSQDCTSSTVSHMIPTKDDLLRSLEVSLLPGFQSEVARAGNGQLTC